MSSRPPRVKPCPNTDGHFFKQVVEDLGFCGCGNPEAAFDLVRDLLRLCPFYENHEAIHARLPVLGVRMLVLYTIDNADLIEHGGNIESSWITDKGSRFLALLEGMGRKYDDFDDVGLSCNQCPDWPKWAKP